MLSRSLLDSYIGKSMSEICLNGFGDTSANHCAHFVSHVLNLSFGYTCKSHKGGFEPGGNLRVHEMFDHCPLKSLIQESSSELKGIIFVSKDKNFVTKGGKTTLRNVPKKHVGILLSGHVWHYGNTKNEVRNQIMTDFMYHYRGQTNALWLGTLPPGARAVAFGEC